MPLSRVPTAQLTGALSFRNRIINGDMRIDQRNNGASVSSDGAYPCDRFGAFRASGTFTAQQSSIAPAGFTTSLLYTSTATTTTPYAGVPQIIEGNNIADFGWGSASAQSVTLSFWVRSSLTGMFGGSLRNSAANRSYVFQYTINAANTWEQKTVNITGDTSGTWLTTNGAGIRVWFDTGSDTARLSTAGAWSAGDYLGVTGSTRVTNTNGATFYITGVQLEAGTVATPFERRDYGRELMMCQRYFAQLEYTAAYDLWVSTYLISQEYHQAQLNLPVTMRAVPTLSQNITLTTFNTTGSYALVQNKQYVTVRIRAATTGTCYAANTAAYTLSASAEL